MDPSSQRTAGLCEKTGVYGRKSLWNQPLAQLTGHIIELNRL
ncbi:unnamed protein product [Phyllotreta striolata]|uniref:Uncharacterized protein n=1 Tax=Phyllotreta striolata TaxID=444603 RepID=A0A9N9TTL9_PHYSR|nr:unnamed protein product [Phyllotreta striolata]